MLLQAGGLNFVSLLSSVLWVAAAAGQQHGPEKSETASSSPRLLPLPSFGSEVRGVDVTRLAQRLGDPADTGALGQARWLAGALHTERLLAFRGIANLPWEDQIRFTSIFGSGHVFNESCHSNREKHAQAPDDRVAVISNSASAGSTGVGTEGYHIDGNVVPIPHGVTLIHSKSAVEGGDTFFVPLRELTQQLRKDEQIGGRCVERAPPCLGGDTGSAPRSDTVPLDDVMWRSKHAAQRSSGSSGAPWAGHPLIYPHPVTGQDTMMFGMGSLSADQFGRGCLQPELQFPQGISKRQTDDLKAVINTALAESDRVLRWRWSAGDLLVIDNLAVAHRASDGSQTAPEDVGLRLMHRTTVQSFDVPKKRPYLTNLPHQCIQEVQEDGSGYYCMFSLAAWMNYSAAGSGDFDSRDTANARCRVLSPAASLAMPSTIIRNRAAARVVSSVGEPHWLGANDGDNGDKISEGGRATEETNGIVAWLDEGLVNNQELHVGQPYEVNDTVLESETWPWHVESGQPNDCDGPGTETCMFIGPHGRWFDFACAPKVANRETGVTAGPEVRAPPPGYCVMTRIGH